MDGAVRRAALSAARVTLVAGPTVLAFFAGGYFAGPRAWAGLIAWALVAIALIVRAGRAPSGSGGRVALVGMGLLAVLSAFSMLWAPVVSDAYHATQIAVLYLGVFVAATLLLDSPGSLRDAELMLALGTLVVIGYGLSERLVPGVLHFARSVDADGRLDQPLTYWNAMGELAAMGAVLMVRIAGDITRPRWVRSVAAASFVPLGVGVYISFSRGALFALFAGLLALAIIVRRHELMTAMTLVLAVTVLASAVTSQLAGVANLSGSLSFREADGAVELGVLVVLMIATGASHRLIDRRRRAGPIPLPSWAGWAAAAATCVGLALAIVLGAHESSGTGQPLTGSSSRLVSLHSNRYDYWRVALRAFAQEPVHGVGAGNWNIYWLRWRRQSEFAVDAHSLPLQTLAELGLLGVLALAALLVGTTLAARAALAITPAAAGPVSALVVYLAHAPLDWDWQMPALTLVAVVLAGAVIAQRPLTATAPNDPWPNNMTAARVPVYGPDSR